MMEGMMMMKADDDAGHLNSFLLLEDTEVAGVDNDDDDNSDDADDDDADGCKPELFPPLVRHRGCWC